MRHVKAESYGYIDGPFNRPCVMSYTFKNPTKDRVYVKVLKFVEKHPKCKRSDIQKGVWGESRPGLNSTLFSQMLYADLIDYNAKFEYVVRRKGKSILKKVNKKGKAK